MSAAAGGSSPPRGNDEFVKRAFDVCKYLTEEWATDFLDDNEMQNLFEIRSSNLSE